MEKFLMFVLLFGVVAVMGQDGDSCADQTTRYDCGWLGIDEETCLARDCCWDSNVSGGTPYCYFNFDTYYDGLCPVAPSERVDCGYVGITKEQCLSKSCCWDESVPDAKWCFNQPVFMLPESKCFISGRGGAEELLPQIFNWDLQIPV
ncbi:hypothetical protein OS493_037437 [Desmophyllum pertusum]|uniref:P-type domain-containing protein n=1 Tax=Desmophyllum pertusum TaxID=174260 RepID=A0A9W9YHY4_9CNID|nr:hypothetical protein OS493_037437 [Desmophyllum pertusum]